MKEAPDIKGAAGAALTVFTESGERGKQKGREKVKQTQFFLTTSQERLEATERRYESICQQNKQFEDRLQEQKEEGDDIAAYLTMRMKGSERLGHMEEIDTIGREKIIAAHQRRLYNLNKEKEATEQYLEEQLEEITKEVVEAEEDLNATTEVSAASPVSTLLHAQLTCRAVTWGSPPPLPRRPPPSHAVPPSASLPRLTLHSNTRRKWSRCWR